ncbi:MAG TPA: hypothetical protein VKP30_16230 [Polyangiaceae bacterium]|nr:hypothetical protein [Polyangiaceae bacterium]
MKEPERWIVSRAEREGQWIRAALSEEPPDAALSRIVSRLSSAGVAVGAISATVTQVAHAGTSVYAGLANSSLVGGVAGTASLSTPVLVGATLLKAVLIGFGIGGGALFAGHLANAVLSRAPTSSASVADSAHIVASSAANDCVLPVTVGAARGRAEVTTQPRATGHVSSPQGKSAHGAGREQRDASVEPQAVLPKCEGGPTESNAPAALSKEAVDIAASNAFRSDSKPTAATTAHRVEQRTLALEVAALAKARQALKQGKADVALQELSALSERGGSPRLGPEAALLQVEALALSGQRESAAALARELLASGMAEAHRVRLLHFAQQR